MGILSIQSHVVYGYVGNKSAVYPLQSMGYDVWPVNTVQFSSHTGYENWRGDVFSREHISSVINAIEALGAIEQCQAIISGYMGSQDICLEVAETVDRFKAKNDKIIYLCDPVMGNSNCFVKPEVVDFFKTGLRADIITPNQFEAEMLSGIKINNTQDLPKVAAHFHELGIKIVVITGIKGLSKYTLAIFISDGVEQQLIAMQEYDFKIPVNGTGDLFTAVLLGTYIVTKNAIEAAKNAAYYLDLVTKNTFAAKCRELQVISTRYDALNKHNIESIDINKTGL
jgi:pyridoxine kinase